jgi:hypothetical protein
MVFNASLPQVKQSIHIVFEISKWRTQTWIK